MDSVSGSQVRHVYEARDLKSKNVRRETDCGNDCGGQVTVGDQTVGEKGEHR